MRSTGMLVAAAVCTFALAVHAQETKTETTIKGGEAKAVTFSGCVKSGTETKTYTLAEAVPIGTTTTTVTEAPVGTSGVTTQTTKTTYALVPGEKVELQEQIGHKVEVTGMMIGGDVKKETKTKTEGNETKTEEKVKAEGALPQFRVTSVKDLGEPCS